MNEGGLVMGDYPQSNSQYNVMLGLDSLIYEGGGEVG